MPEPRPYIAPNPRPGGSPSGGNVQDAGQGPSLSKPFSFSAVLLDELDAIRRRRELSKDDNPHADPPEDWAPVETGDVDETAEDQKVRRARARSLREHTTGLAFSGGGIRAATFAVGFLQGLAELELVRRFDYLSTVSGGGYAGGWLAAWLRREGGPPANVERQLSPSRLVQAEADRTYAMTDPPGARLREPVDEEPEPLRHLRAYSSYLTPRPGLFSVDRWTVALIWVRNVAANLMVFIPLMLWYAVLARVLVYAFNLLNGVEPEVKWWSAWLASGLLGVGIGFILLGLSASARAVGQFRAGKGSESAAWPPVGFHIRVASFLAPLALAIPLRYVVWKAGSAISLADAFGVVRESVRSHPDLLGWPNFLAHTVVFGLALALVAFVSSLRWAKLRGEMVRAVLSGAAGGAALPVLAIFLRLVAPDFWLLRAVGDPWPPALGVVAVLAILAGQDALDAFKHDDLVALSRDGLKEFLGVLKRCTLLALLGMTGGGPDVARFRGG